MKFYIVFNTSYISLLKLEKKTNYYILQIDPMFLNLILLPDLT